jgi:hypothetical protein
MAIALTTVGLSACGSSTQTTSTSSITHATTPPPRTHHRVAPVSHLPGVGATQTVHAPEAALSVTLTRVIDPLGGSGAALVPGTRAVGVLVQINNRGPGVYDSSATGDISVVPSFGSAMPAFAPHGVCQTPLRDFDNYISPGEVRSGCVVFAAPSGARVAAVRFSPHGQSARPVSWRG